MFNKKNVFIILIKNLRYSVLQILINFNNIIITNNLYINYNNIIIINIINII